MSEGPYQRSYAVQMAMKKMYNSKWGWIWRKGVVAIISEASKNFVIVTLSSRKLFGCRIRRGLHHV